MEQAKVQTLDMIASIMHAMNIEGNLTKHSTTHVIHWRHQKTCQGSQIRPSPMGSDYSIAWGGPDEKQVHPKNNKTTYAHMWKLQHEAIWGHNNSHQYLSMNFKRLHIKIALKIQESSLFHHDFSLPSGHCNGSTMLQCYHAPKTACFNQHCLGPNNCWILRNKFPHQKHTGKSSHNHDFGQDMHVHTNIRPKCKASICQLAIRTSRQGFFPTMQCLCTYLSCTNSCCKSITNAWNEQ